ncbi:unnamed protein product [Urochloa humidicola]
MAALEPDAPRSSSASAIVGGWATGRHVLHIDAYSRTKEELPMGKSIRSRPFRVGGLSWIMDYLPNGHSSEYADFITVFLKLDAAAASSASSSDPPVQVVKARARFSLLHQGSSKPVPSYTRETGLREFSAPLRSCVGGTIMGTRDMEIL